MIGMDRSHAQRMGGTVSNLMVQYPLRGSSLKTWAVTLEKLRRELDFDFIPIRKLQTAFTAIAAGGPLRPTIALWLKLDHAAIDEALKDARSKAAATPAAMHFASDVARSDAAAEKYAADVERSAELMHEEYMEKAGRLAKQKQRQKKRAAKQKAQQQPPEPAHRLSDSQSSKGTLYFCGL